LQLTKKYGIMIVKKKKDYVEKSRQLIKDIEDIQIIAVCIISFEFAFFIFLLIGAWLGWPD